LPLFFEVGNSGGGAQHCGQMPAGRRTPCADSVAIEPELVGVCPQPPHSRLAVLDLRGEDRLLAQSIVDARNRIPMRRQLECAIAFGTRSATRPEGAGMNPDNDGQESCPLGRAIQVQKEVLRSCLPIHDAPLHLKAGRQRSGSVAPNACARRYGYDHQQDHSLRLHI
jgi:hypothetical protein